MFNFVREKITRGLRPADSDAGLGCPPKTASGWCHKPQAAARRDRDREKRLFISKALAKQRPGTPKISIRPRGAKIPRPLQLTFRSSIPARPRHSSVTPPSYSPIMSAIRCLRHVSLSANRAFAVRATSRTLSRAALPVFAVRAAPVCASTSRPFSASARALGEGACAYILYVYVRYCATHGLLTAGTQPTCRSRKNSARSSSTRRRPPPRRIPTS